MDVEVAAAAIVSAGRVLAARRTHPADVAGGWELPGGKVDPGETVADAVRREVREELGCAVAYVRALAGRSPIKPGYALTAHLVTLTDGDPVPHEHDAIRWLGPEELDEVAWLPADLPFLDELRELLLDGELLEGGNVGGAVRIGTTVRRATGAWTPAVHALLDHLAATGLDGVPRVLGTDARGREVLTYLPGRVPDVDHELLTDDALVDAMRWLGRYHQAVRDFRHPGPWRTSAGDLAEGELICHHDFAPYNLVLAPGQAADRVVGVFDWDMAGPGRPLVDIAFAAWNMVPLWRDLPADLTLWRLHVLASSYPAGTRAPLASVPELLAAAVARVRRSLNVIEAGQLRRDPGMLNLGLVGEPARTRASLRLLEDTVPGLVARWEEVGADPALLRPEG